MADQAIEKDQQFDGYRQVWTQRPDGVFDGPFTAYWGSGPALCMRGHYRAGARHGVWTYWDRDGDIDRQVRFDNDEPIETRTAPPWLEDKDAGGPALVPPGWDR